MSKYDFESKLKILRKKEHLKILDVPFSYLLSTFSGYKS